VFTFDERLPKDASVLSVHADWAANSIDLLVESGEFEEVPPGMMPPQLDFTMGLTIIRSAGKDGA
jgi:hypothetical protein